MRRTVLFMLVCLPMLAFADLSAVYKMQGGETMTIHYRDSDHVRMNLAPGAFMLVTDGKAYMVNGQNGQWVAVDTASMGKMMQQMGGAMMSGGAGQAADKAGDYQFRKTGRTETVAGYEGRVYEAVAPDGQSTEVVVSSNEDIRTLSRAWMELSGKMIGNMGSDAGKLDSLMEREDVQELGGTLRVGDSMRLQSVSREDKPEAFFQLPPGTRIQDMSQMRMPGR